jgi:hypothetical protein
MICKSFFLESAPQRQATLFDCLSEGLQLFLQELPTAILPANRKISSSKETIDLIHFSWFAPFLRSLSETDIRLFLSVLSLSQVEGLRRSLRFTNHLPHPNSHALTFLRKRLLQQLIEENEEILPKDCLPLSPLNPLAEMDHATLAIFIHYFGLHDLAFEMRQIIETARLKRIFQSLPQKSHEYLNFLLSQKEPFLLQRMTLQNWDGKKETLMAQIDKSGILRLGKILYDQDLSLIWYVVHHLEVSIASLVQKFCTPMESSKAKQALMEQAIKILSFIKK